MTRCAWYGRYNSYEWCIVRKGIGQGYRSGLGNWLSLIVHATYMDALSAIIGCVNDGYVNTLGVRRIR